MAKKKNHKPAAAAADQAEKQTAERKPNKKERRAMAEQRSKELKAKRKKVSLAALLVAGAAVVINFATNSYYGQPIYEWIQIGCFLLMGISGGIFMYGARYEESEQQQRSKRSLGLVFIAVALGVILIETVQMLMH